MFGDGLTFCLYLFRNRTQDVDKTIDEVPVLVLYLFLVALTSFLYSQCNII